MCLNLTHWLLFGSTLVATLKASRDVFPDVVLDEEILQMSKMNPFVVSSVPVTSAVVALLKPESDKKVEFCQKVFKALGHGGKLSKLPTPLQARFEAACSSPPPSADAPSARVSCHAVFVSFLSVDGWMDGAIHRTGATISGGRVDGAIRRGVVTDLQLDPVRRGDGWFCLGDLASPNCPQCRQLLSEVPGALVLGHCWHSVILRSLDSKLGRIFGWPRLHAHAFRNSSLSSLVRIDGSRACRIDSKVTISIKLLRLHWSSRLSWSYSQLTT